MARPFLTAWLTEDAEACALLDIGVRSVKERREKVLRAAKRTISPVLAAALRAADEKLPPSAARRENLDALASGGVAAIVTGQQVGLFLGPLYTFYKAASAIVLARELQAETGVRCVPVFWLQTEDHDYAEINHTYLPGAGSPVKVSLPDDDQRISIAHRLVPDEIEAALAMLTRELGELPHSSLVLDQLRSAYRPGQSLVAAFAQVLAYCFADEGLIFVDPRQPAIAELTAPILRRSIREHGAIERALADRRAHLETAGFAEQVAARDGSPLAFYHLGSPVGPRHRLTKTDRDTWELFGAAGEVTDAELMNADPMRLSTSALLRPIVQDTLLPTAAYVGGPGELAYFAQLAPLYRHFSVEQPAFAMRARVRCIDHSSKALLDRLGLSAREVERPREELLAKLVRSDFDDPSLVRARLLDGATRELDALEKGAPSLDENLLRPIARTRATLERAVGRFVERYRKARLEKDRVLTERLDRLQAILFPSAQPQERVLGVPYFIAKYGLTEWKARVLAAIQPFDPAVVEVFL